MDTESLQHEIKKTLPELENEMLKTLAAHLIDVVGVRNREDLIFVGSDDITSFLTPIQSRKLIQAFKNGECILSVLFPKQRKKIVSLFTHPQVIPNINQCLFSNFFHTLKVLGDQQLFGYPHSSKYHLLC